jgi:hypothetical protein
MKTKNLILGVSAFALAIGSVFATSSLALIPVYIRAQSVAGGTFNCVNISRTCDNTVSGTCQVTVNVTNPSGPAVKTVSGRTQTTCSVLNFGSSITLPATVSYYDVQ